MSAAGVITRAVAKVKVPSGSKQGQPWIDPMLDLTDLDDMIGKFLPLSTERPVKSSSAEADINIVVSDLKKNFTTNVLATVKVSGWAKHWIWMTALVVIENYSKCKHVNLVAVAGGPMCQCELLFLSALLEELGFSHTRAGLADSCIDAPIKTKTGTLGTKTFWSIGRMDEMNEVSTFEVRLWVFSDVDNFDVSSMTLKCCPRKQNNQAPNLIRVGILSCPVTGEDGNRIDEKLNSKLVEVLDLVASKAKQHGWELYDELHKCVHKETEC